MIPLHSQYVFLSIRSTPTIDGEVGSLSRNNTGYRQRSTKKPESLDV